MSNRFDLKEATKQRTKPPPRVLVYGEHKIGKTSFAAQLPDACLIVTESGADRIDVPRLPADGYCETWAEVGQAAKVLAEQEHGFKWVALDTLNGAARLCAEYVCENYFSGVWNAGKGQEGFNSFGKGDKATAQEFIRLLRVLDQIRARGIGVLLLAHTGLVRQGNALGDDFYKFSPSLDKNVSALAMQWVDQIGHATFDVEAKAKKGETKAKANLIGSSRWLYWGGEAGREAGCRAGYELPARMLFDAQTYLTNLEQDPIAALVAQCSELLTVLGGEAKAKAIEGVKKATGAKEVSDAVLRKLPKARLESMINWMQTQTEKESEQ